jgi:hypothetical protein
LVKEPAINNRISDYVKVSTKLVRLHDEFRTALSLAPDPEELEPPTLSDANSESPPIALSNLIESLTKYHDGYAQDLEDAKTDLNSSQACLVDVKEATKDIERALLNANSERDGQRMRLGRLKDRLKAL